MNTELVMVNNQLVVKNPPAELKAKLIATRRVIDTSKRGFNNFKTEIIPLYVDYGDVLITPSGLYSKVSDFLKAKQIQFTVTKQLTYKEIAEISPEIKEQCRLGQESILEAVRQNYGGVIKAPPGFGKTKLIGFLCKMCKDAKVLIITQKRDVLLSIRDRLTSEFSDIKLCVCNATNDFDQTADVCICSSKSLHHVPAEWPGVLFYDECHSSAAPGVFPYVLGFFNTRRYGFSATPKGRADSSDTMNEALFGDFIAEVTYGEAVDANLVVPIEVWLDDIEGAELPYKQKIALERHGIWRNETRNERIAEIAREVERLGLSKILIMTSKTEHALSLLRLLPEYSLVCSTITPEKMEYFEKLGILPKDILERLKGVELMRSQFQKSLVSKVIATGKWDTGVDLVELQVLIRTDGMPGVIPSVQIAGRLSRKTEGKTKGILIDFLDSFDKRLNRRAKSRISHYKKEGWLIKDYPLKKEI